MNNTNQSLSWAGKGLKSLNEEFVEKPQNIIHLALSQNQLKTGKDLGKFSSLKTLVIDQNFLYTLADVPVLPYLDTLSANKNQFKDLEEFLEHSAVKFPSLTNLSLMKNPLMPHFIGEAAYYQFRLRVTKKLVNL